MANWFENVSQTFTGDSQSRRFTLRRITTIIVGMMVVAGVLLVPVADSTARAQTTSAFTNLQSSDFNVNDSHNQYGNNSRSYDLTLTSYIIRS